MRVCVITTSFPRFPGDYSGVFVYRLCQALALLNIEIDVIAPADCNGRASEMMGGCRVYRFRYFFLKSFQRLAYGPGGIPTNLKRCPWRILFLPFFMLMFLLKTVQVSKNADLIHAQWLYTGFIASIVKKVYGTPFILTLRGSDVLHAQKGKLGRFMSHWIIKQASFITTVNQDMKNWVLEQGVSEDTVTAIRNGVDLNRADKKQLDTSICRFIFVGNLVSGKGVYDLLAAFSLVYAVEQNIALVVVGEGDARERLQSIVREKGLEEIVTFLGAVPGDQIPLLMSEADCLVLPSLSEGTPNVVLEAMASGLPVVATNLPGICELVKDGVSGLLVTSQNVEDLKKALLKMIQNPKQRAKMGRSAYQRIVDMKLAWSESARQYREVYEKICAESQVSST